MKSHFILALFSVFFVCKSFASDFEFSDDDPIAEHIKELDDQLAEEEYETFFGSLFDIPVEA